MDGEIGLETILGRLRDEGMKPILVNRLKELVGDVSQGDLARFCGMSRGALAGAYNARHRGEKSLGAKTWAAFDRFCAVWREYQFDVRAAAKAVVDEQERREAEKAEMREEILDREVESDFLLSAMDALEKLGYRKFPLRELLDFHDRARRAADAKGGAR